MANDGIRRAPTRAPTHPGATLREDVFPDLGLSVSDAARHLGVTRQALHRVLSGTAAVSPEMALRLGKLVGNGPDLRLRMQASYDLWKVAQHVDVSKIPTIRAA